jgi:flagellar operon protein
MLISEYLQLRNIASAVTTGNVSEYSVSDRQNTADPSQGQTSTAFADELMKQLEASRQQTVPAVNAEDLSEQSAVQFSKHAIERINERNIDLYSDDRLDRLNRAVELAAEKGSNDALIFIDSAAFLVSVKNNKVITTVNAEDMQGNIFTNIDSTVVM